VSILTLTIHDLLQYLRTYGLEQWTQAVEAHAMMQKNSVGRTQRAPPSAAKVIDLPMTGNSAAICYDQAALR
jgi:hypothetical protein